jgi:hypothetical protein
MKQEPVKWNKVFVRCSLDNRLISRTCKELQKLDTKRTNNLINKQENELNEQFSKAEVKSTTNT